MLGERRTQTISTGAFGGSADVCGCDWMERSVWPTTGLAQRSTESLMRKVVYELRGIKQELSEIQRKMK